MQKLSTLMGAHPLLLLVSCLMLAGCGKSLPASASPRQPAGSETAAAVPSIALPKLTGRVVDNAGLIAPASEARLVERLGGLEARTNDQFVVVTVPNLGGRSIEEFGVSLGRGWGIGQADKNNGVLLIVAPSERKVRLEVGYGLERVLSDERCAQIIENDILPQFRKGSMEQGIMAGVDAVLAVLQPGDSVAPERKAA